MPAVDDRGPFVGRSAEVAHLTARLERATGGSGGIVLIAGDPGIGKTRLMDELAHRAAERDARVLWGRCHEGEGAPAFWPWTQIIRALLADDDANEALDALSADAADLAQLLPELRAHLTVEPSGATVEPEQARFRLFDTVRRLLARSAAARPLLLLVDDLHWADAPSLLLLQFLAREIRSLPVLLLGTFRDGEVESGRPLAQTLAALARVEGTSQRALAGLDAPDVGDFLAALLGAPPLPGLIESVTDRTEGNPFFVGELARLLATDRHAHGPWIRGEGPSPLPPGARAVLDQRLAGLSPACLEVLGVAAVIGRDLRLDLLAQVAAGGTDAALDALEEAEAARAIVPVSGPAGRYRFAHALIRESLYARLPAARRLRLHRRVCDALEQLYGTAREEHLAELAHHARQSAPGGDAERAVRYARQAGDQALVRLAYEEAARQYRFALEALELIPAAEPGVRAALLLALGEAENAAGDAEAGETTFAEAATAARAAGDADMLARAALGFGGERLAQAGADPRRIALLEEALAAVGEDGERRALRVRLLTSLSEALRSPGDLARRRATSESAVSLARTIDDPRLLVGALSARCAAYWGPDGAPEVPAAVAEMLALAEAAADPALALCGQHWQILDLLTRGELRDADGAIERFAALAEERRDPFRRWQAAALRGVHPQADGRFAEAEARAAEARASGERVNRANAEETYRYQISTGRVQRDGWSALIPLFRAATVNYPEFVIWRAQLAVAYADAGEEEAARREFELVAAAGFASLPRIPTWLNMIAVLARACTLLDDRRHAATLYALLEPSAGGAVFAENGLSWYAAVDHWLGLLATTLGHWDAAEHHFDAALALYARNGVAAWAARSQHAYGAMLLARRAPGDDERARMLLGQALATANRLGMITLAAQIRATRPEVAGRPARRDSLPDGLTEREGEVLRLLAAGKSNQEIAHALVLSVRTVERHIANLYPKIGAHNRADAAAYAVRHGLA